MRRISGVAFAALAISSLTLVAPGQTSPAAEAATLTALPATQADKVVDAYGVGIHTNFLDTPYADATKVADALSDLGVRHVRDDLYLDAPRQYAAIRTIADRGVKFDLIMGRPDLGRTPADYVSTVATQLTGAVESLEGVNEWDHFSKGSLTWAADLVSWQKRLYAAAKADPATANLPVLAPSLAFAANYPALVAAGGDMSPYADLANGHMYPGGYEPWNSVDLFTKAIRTLIPTKPLITTEAGYHNAINTTNGHLPTSETAAGVYLPRLLLDHVKRGEQRVYSYELIDEFADDGLTNPEANFGLLRRDWSPKPAYTAMKTMLGLLADPGPAFTPTALSMASEGWPSDGRYLVTQKRDGAYVLLMWRDKPVWDPVARKALAVDPVGVTLQFGQDLDMSVYRPSQGPSPVASATGSSLPIQLGADVTAVTLTPAQVPSIVSTTSTAPVLEPAPATGSVPDAPYIAKVTAKKGSVTVTWRKPAANGRPILAYQLVSGTKSVSFGPDVLQGTISGLKGQVEVGVRARNELGWGPYSYTPTIRARHR